MSVVRRPFDPVPWQGRIDREETGDASRWHQHIQPWVPGSPAGVALAGFACDVGVRRNQGRPGAEHGPQAIRRALANLAWHQARPAWDAGDVHADPAGDDLEGAQAAFAATVAALLGEGHRVIALGGGHEIAQASFRGLAMHLGARKAIGVVNLDAHFDLRAGARGSSGTPFREIAADCERDARAFRYLCLGIDEDANTRALFDTARRLGAAWRPDTECTAGRLAEALSQVEAFVAGVECVHLSIDLDALPSAVAPGVSAPAARGVPLEFVEAVAGAVVASGKLAVADIAELNPAFDLDGRTARVAARIVARLARN